MDKLKIDLDRQIFKANMNRNQKKKKPQNKNNPETKQVTFI